MNNAILIPTDFSDHSRQAILFAADNFADASSKFILLNAYANLPKASAPMISLHDILKRRSEEGLEREAMFLSKYFGHSNPNVAKISRPDSLADAIKFIVAREKVRMIVMGFSKSDIDHRALTNMVRTPLLLVPS